MIRLRKGCFRWQQEYPPIAQVAVHFFQRPLFLGPAQVLHCKMFRPIVLSCGGTAMLDGKFIGLDNAIGIVRSNAITPERLKQFAVLLRDAYERKATVEET